MSQSETFSKISKISNHKILILGDCTDAASRIVNLILQNTKASDISVVWGLQAMENDIVVNGWGDRVTIATRPNYVAHGMKAAERHVDELAAECISIVWVSNAIGPPPHVLTSAEHHNCNLLDVNNVTPTWQELVDAHNLLFVPPDPELADWPRQHFSEPPPRHFFRSMRNRLAPDFWTTRATFLEMEQRQDCPILPPPKMRLRAFGYTPFCRVRVVIMGQDPYPQDGNADGLAFSVPCSRPVPASLRTILDELHRDEDVDKPLEMFEGEPLETNEEDDLGERPRLESWAKQGVFLCNTVLTVREGEPASHQKVAGWEILTDQCIAAISEETKFCVFMLWGQMAQTKSKFIDKRHLVLRAGHPSPKNKGKGFAMCGHFGKANNALRSKGFAPIAW